MDIISLFCEVDDFFLAYKHYQAQHQLPKINGTGNTRGRPRSLHPRFADYAGRSKTSMG